MKPQTKIPWYVPFLAFLMVFAAWILAPLFIPLVFFSYSINPNDSFDILNTLFSGFAFLGVVIAILYQRNELRLQALELTNAKRDVEQQIEYLHQQTELLRASNISQSIIPLLMEYRSKEMLEAVGALWEFRRKNDKHMVDAYEKQYRKNVKLHHQRRLVSQYYGILSGLYSFGIIPQNVLFAYWSKKDLRIIPEVIIPIEIKLEALLFRGGGDKQSSNKSSMQRWTAMMLQLYNDAPGDAG